MMPWNLLKVSVPYFLAFHSKLFDGNIAYSNLVGFCQKWHSNFIFFNFRFLTKNGLKSSPRNILIKGQFLEILFF